MRCPSCNHILQKLSVTTNAGGRFDVEHCGRCGGTWFDPYEINRIPYHEVARLAHITVLPKNKPKEQASSLCPRCHSKLGKFSAESVPCGISLARCGKCHGIWATQKALEGFKKHQNKVVTHYKKSKIAFPALSLAFIPVAFTVLLLITTFATVSSLQTAKEGRIRAAKLISAISVQPISETKVSITFQTKTAIMSEVSYGTSSIDYTTKTISKKPSTNHSILISNLKPNTSYIYHITLFDEKARKLETGKKIFSTMRVRPRPSRGTDPSLD